MEILLVSLKVISELLPKLPNYNQTKKNKFYKLLKDYEDEIRSEVRDDQRADNLRSELIRFLEVFRVEING